MMRSVLLKTSELFSGKDRAAGAGPYPPALAGV